MVTVADTVPAGGVAVLNPVQEGVGLKVAVTGVVVAEAGVAKRVGTTTLRGPASIAIVSMFVTNRRRRPGRRAWAAVLG